MRQTKQLYTYLLGMLLILTTLAIVIAIGLGHR